MKEEKLTKRIKIVNCVLISFFVVDLFFLIINTLWSEQFILAFIPFIFIPVLVFEIIDLKTNRGFYQIKAIINSIMGIAIYLLLLLIYVPRMFLHHVFIFLDTLFIVILSAIFLLFFIYHGLLAIRDRKYNKQRINIKNAIITTIELVLIIPIFVLVTMFIFS